MRVKCNKCDGTGKFDDYICMKCYGHGEVPWIENMIEKEIVLNPKKFSFYEEINEFICNEPLKEEYQKEIPENWKVVRKRLMNEINKFCQRMIQKYGIFDTAYSTHLYKNTNLVFILVAIDVCLVNEPRWLSFDNDENLQSRNGVFFN